MSAACGGWLLSGSIALAVALDAGFVFMILGTISDDQLALK